MNFDHVFTNETGLRAGWRLLIWLAIVLIMTAVVGVIAAKLFRAGEHAFLDPSRMIIGDLVGVLIPVFVSTWVMAKVEGRTLQDYYVPDRSMLAPQFWWGLLWGFLAISVLVGMISAAGGYKIQGLEAGGSTLVSGIVLWVLAALVIGVVEEFAFRAYILRTLADGIGFWLAAVLLSLGFGALHYFTKPYERWEDFASTGLLGLFLCFTIRRTGTLAFAIGWHAAFDWGAIYLYSGRNAGEVAKWHLLRTSWLGTDRVTGGLLGPEASWFVFILIALLFAAFGLVYRRDLVKQVQPASED